MSRQNRPSRTNPVTSLFHWTMSPITSAEQVRWPSALEAQERRKRGTGNLLSYFYVMNH